MLQEFSYERIKGLWKPIFGDKDKWEELSKLGEGVEPEWDQKIIARGQEVRLDSPKQVALGATGRGSS